MSTINKATFCLNKRHIEAFRSDWELYGDIHDKSAFCIV